MRHRVFKCERKNARTIDDLRNLRPGFFALVQLKISETTVVSRRDCGLRITLRWLESVHCSSSIPTRNRNCCSDLRQLTFIQESIPWAALSHVASNLFGASEVSGLGENRRDPTEIVLGESQCLISPIACFVGIAEKHLF